jgi:recombination protein RecA
MEVIPSGFPALDAALGIGGLPCGRISEISGPDASGKQALAAHLIAQCQRAEGVAAYIDVGRQLDPDQMKVVGVDLDSLLVARPGDAPHAVEMAVRLARGGGIRLLIFDATDSLQPRGGGPQFVASGFIPDGSTWGTRTTSGTSPSADSFDRDCREALGQASRLSALPDATAEPPAPTHNGSSAGASPSRSLPITSLLLRRLVSAVDKHGVAFVFITSSQSSGLSPQPSRNGQALRFFASVRLAMERTEWVRRGREVVGCRSTVRVAKNKLSPPHREAAVELLFYRFPPSMPAVQLCRPVSATAPAPLAVRAAAQI